jgi:signal recognition particle receptor subunit beta
VTGKSHRPESCWIGVTGDFNSGKTAFIRSISEQTVVSAEIPANIGSMPTLAVDRGRIKVDDHLYLDLYGNPGAFSASGIFRVTVPNVLGMIVLVNSADPRFFRVARSLIATLSAFNQFTYVVAANPFQIGVYDPIRQNFAKPVEGWPIDDLRTALRVPDEIPIIPCIAIDNTSVKAVLIALLEKVIEALDASDETEDPV